MSSHNHSAQWVEQVVGSPGPDGGTDAGPGTDAGTCGAEGATCGGSSPVCCPDVMCCQGLCLPSCAQ